MKTIKIIIALLFLSSSLTQAQSAASFEEGTNTLNLGIGLLGGYTYAGYSGVSSTPAFSAYYERSVATLGPGKLGLGAGLEYRNLSYNYSFGSYKASWSYTIVSARGAYHPDFINSEKGDAYAGLALGYGIVTYKDSYFDSFNTGNKSSYPSYFYSSFFLGGRYYFTNNIGLFGEIGSGLTLLKAGVALKF